jgi:GTP-binding protein HflX
LHDGRPPADNEEFGELARAAGTEPVASVNGTRKVPDPAYFVGSGKVHEICICVQNEEAEVVLVNHELTPAQERNLEREVQCRVLDRTGLILDIFAQRARSFEGKLQVELAQLQHLSTRLVRGWTHLERQKGGIGLRGPGETQLETDRRLLGERIRQIHKRLDKVRSQREQGRQARQRAEIPAVSLVGYTNAGKSTLFNYLTHGSVYTANLLFATLDPTLRRVEPPGQTPFILADTVGFIRQLPHDLVAAFHATLEETARADVLLHVVDAADSERQMRIEQVNTVLHEIGADKIPQILVYNKIDRLPDESVYPRSDRDKSGHVYRVWLSGITGWGTDLLLDALDEHIRPVYENHWLRIPATAGHARARCHATGKVLHEHFEPNGDCVLQVAISHPAFVRLCKSEPGVVSLEGFSV